MPEPAFTRICFFVLFQNSFLGKPGEAWEGLGRPGETWGGLERPGEEYKKQQTLIKTKNKRAQTKVPELTEPKPEPACLFFVQNYFLAGVGKPGEAWGGLGRPGEAWKGQREEYKKQKP